MGGTEPADSALRQTAPNLLVCGSLLNADLMLANFLAHQGYSVTVPRHPTQPASLDELSGRVPHLCASNIVTYNNGLDFFNRARRVDAIVMCGVVLVGYLGRAWPLGLAWPLPPILLFTLGSDLRELAGERSLPGWLARRTLRKAHRIIISPDEECATKVSHLDIRQWDFIRFPYAIDEPLGDMPRAGPITYLLASRLDWGVTDNGPERNATKENDKFLRAFLRRAEEGANIRLIVMDRGSDRELAHKLVAVSPARDRVEWHPPTSQAGLRKLFQRTDIVVDQFMIGSHGALCIEAMAAGKAVMTYIDAAYVGLVYDDLPMPLINCHSEEDIYRAIGTYRDRESLIALGVKAANWIARWHRDPASYRRLLAMINMAAGWPMAWTGALDDALR